MKLSVCVYCGSRLGDSPRFAACARELGALIAEAGAELVYGGGKVGLMGTVADAVLDAGGRVFGVIPEALMTREVGHAGLQELHVVQTMHERKRLMAERANAFVALPGGIGTLEELYEVWSWQQLGYHSKPVALLNVDGYYDALIEFMKVSHRRGFTSDAQFNTLLVDTDTPSLWRRIVEATPATPVSDDYSRI